MAEVSYLDSFSLPAGMSNSRAHRAEPSRRAGFAPREVCSAFYITLPWEEPAHVDSGTSEGPGPQSSIPERKAGGCHARSMYLSIIFIQEIWKEL